MSGHGVRQRVLLRRVLRIESWHELRDGGGLAYPELELKLRNLCQLGVA